MRRSYVLDASVVVPLLVAERDTPTAEALVERLIRTAELHAPDLIVLEVANALWKRAARGDATPEEAMDSLGDVAASPMALHSGAALAAPALRFALAHGLTAYDATYVALSARLGATLVTNDRALRRRGAGAGLPVVAPADVLAGG